MGLFSWLFSPAEPEVPPVPRGNWGGEYNVLATFGGLDVLGLPLDNGRFDITVVVSGDGLVPGCSSIYWRANVAAEEVPNVVRGIKTDFIYSTLKGRC